MMSALLFHIVIHLVAIVGTWEYTGVHKRRGAWGCVGACWCGRVGTVVYYSRGKASRPCVCGRKTDDSANAK